MTVLCAARKSSTCAREWSGTDSPTSTASLVAMMPGYNHIPVDFNFFTRNIFSLLFAVFSCHLVPTHGMSHRSNRRYLHALQTPPLPTPPRHHHTHTLPRPWTSRLRFVPHGECGLLPQSFLEPGNWYVGLEWGVGARGGWGLLRIHCLQECGWYRPRHVVHSPVHERPKPRRTISVPGGWPRVCTMPRRSPFRQFGSTA